MTISLTQVIANLQADIDAVDSDTSMDQILRYMHRARKLTGLASTYDSAGVLPSADSAYDGMLAFTEKDDAIYKFVDSNVTGGTIRAWHLADSNQEITPDIAVGHNQGTQYGYALGGRVNPGTSNVIQKYSFTSDGNSSDVGDLTQAVFSRQMAVSSSTHALNTAGYAPGATPAGWGYADNIDKIAYASDGNATEAGSLNAQSGDAAAHQDDAYGYLSGGLDAPLIPTQAASKTIQRFALASQSGDTGTDVGDLHIFVRHCSGWSGSDGYAYAANGASYHPTDAGPPSGYHEKIWRFPFAASATSVEVGDTLDIYYYQSGNLQSPTHAYSAGGAKGSTPTEPARNGIEKFPFAASTTQTDVADLATYPTHSPTTGKGNSQSTQGSSSTTHGYVHGGHGSPTPANVYNTIQKFSTSSDANATDVGDLTGVFYNLAGAQY